jgi:spoIIIJ-associated protein
VSELSVEASGETVGEAKWNALRELELRIPRLDRASVRFQVLTEGERGLLGVGYEPARVVAVADGEVAAPPEPPVDESDEAGRLRELLVQVTSAIGVRCRVEVHETDSELTASCFGDDLGLLIGRHGQTIDAVQLLASMIVRPEGGGETRKAVVVDAAGYRDRRRQTLESLAARAAEETARTGERVELEPMSAAERKVIHTSLEGHAAVTTASEGDEPYRRVVVEPAR